MNLFGASLFGYREISGARYLKMISLTKSKKHSAPSAKEGESPWSRPISRRDFMKTGIAVGGIAGAGALVAGRSGLQALQVGQPAAPATSSDPFAAREIALTVNGKPHVVNVEPRSMLVDVLRDTMGLMSVKRPCNRASCGGCTVLIDGLPVVSCTYLALRAVGHSIVTNEIATDDPVVDALQKAWVNQDAMQCAYCSAGLVMSATALLKSNPKPSVADIKSALSLNLCRCGSYAAMIDAVNLAAKNLGGV